MKAKGGFARCISSVAFPGLLLGTLALSVSACGSNSSNKNASTAKLKVAWVYVGPPGDEGWTYAQDQGRQDVAAQMADVDTTYVENVSHDATAAALDKLVSAGNKLIFTTSYDHQDGTIAAAAKYPKVDFENCSGDTTSANMSTYFGRMYEARYLTGIVAGLMTQTGKVGIAAAEPIPEVIRMINAITLGLRSVNPTAEMHVKWVNAWYDEATTATLTTQLLGEGCDVIFQDTDGTAALVTAQTAGKYGIGYNSDELSFAPNAVLTSAVWNWTPYFESRIKAVENGTWTSQSYWGSMSTGIVGLGQWGSMVPQSVKAQVATAQANIENATGEYIFKGPINKQDGTTWKAAGQTFTDTELLNMDQFVEGVVGTIPAP